MGKRTNGTPINAEKLRKEITRRGMTLTDASRELGRATNFISSVINSKMIGKDTIVMLDKLFNIPLDAYKAEEPEAQQPEEPETPQTTVDYKELYNVIYSAVYDVAKRVLTEGQISEVLYESAYEAVKKAWSE